MMPCFDPLVRFELSDGRIKIISMKKLDALEKAGNRFEDSFFIERRDIIPCGRCDGCQADKARKWADRLLLEKSLHDDSWFVTLTFNDKWLPRMCGGTKWPDMYTVSRDHLQKFMKRLRRDLGFPIKFFACGEYGDKGLRPHYHLIIFGLTLPEGDLTPLHRNNLGQMYYTSKLIEKYWSDPDSGESYGFNVVGEVTYESMSYVARYVMKKLRGQDRLLYEAAGMHEPFITMSRNPGIGYWWSIRNPDWVNQNLIFVDDAHGAHGIVPPRYFEKRLQLTDPNLLRIHKDWRKTLREYEDEAKISQTNYTPYEYVKVVENNLQKSLDMLKSLRK